MMLRAKLIAGQLFIGNKHAFNSPRAGSVVTLTDKEDHPIFGDRYKVEYSKEWYEKSCFEWIEKE